MRLLLCLLVMTGLLTSALSASGQDRLLKAWEFNADGDTEGWFPAHSMAPFVVEDGVLKARATGFDPYMHASRGRAFDIQGNDFQYIEIRMKCRVGRSAEFFWAETVEGKDYGFVAGKERHFGTIPDGQFHTYRVFPLWQGRVTRLRLDPVDDDEIEIDYIRIYQQPYEAPVGPKFAWEFNTDGDVEGIIPVRDLDLLKVRDGVARTAVAAEAPTLLTSPTEIDAERARYVCIAMSSTAPAEAQLQWNATGKPEFSAKDSVAFELVGDGAQHMYNLDVGGSAGWRGTIKRLQLSARAPAASGESFIGARWAIDFIRCAPTPQGPADLRLARLTVAPTVGIAGEPVAIEAVLRNAGGERSARTSWSLAVPGGLSVVAGRRVQRIAPVPPGEEVVARWEVVGSAGDSGTFEATLTGDGPGQTPPPVDVLVRSYPGAPMEPPSGVYAVLRAGAAVVGNRRIQAVIPTAGDCPLFLYARRGREWSNLARAAAIARLSVAQEGVVPLTFDDVVLDKTGADAASATLRFHSSVASLSVTVSAETASPALNVSQILTAQRDLRIAALRGAWLLVGDGTFQSDLDFGLFPGLEYLVTGEKSSSTLDIAPPRNLRYAPHPNRVTVPTMAVEKDGWVVGIRWAPLQTWDAGSKSAASHTRPTAVFASPNFLEDASNHLMGLMLPSIPDFLDENSLAAEPGYDLKKGQEMRLKYSIFAREGDVLTATDWHYSEDRVPPLPRKVRPDVETVRLALRGYEELLWDEKAQGWAGVKGWAPTSKAGTAIYFYVASQLYPREPEARRWREKAVRVGKPDHGLDFSFHVGGVVEAIRKVRQAAYGTMGEQPESGGWTFQPDEKHAPLGQVGQEAVGLTAARATQMLRYARIAGDEAALESGLRALRYMEKFRVPRASQVWEVPVHTPDILASSRTAAAYLEGYRITGDRDHLRRAVYWARTGLPFVYAWQAPEIDPVMLYGTIPVFGATWYTGSWFGRLVQWNGLDYAGTLIDLSRYDDSLPWRHIAEGINISGINQMQTREGYQGLYPDSYGMTDNSISWGLMLSSGRILHNLFALAGRDPSVQTQVVATDAGRLHLSSAARISNVKVSESGRTLGATLTYQPGETFYSLLAPVSEASRVLKNRRPLRRADDLDDVAEGWLLDAGSGLLVVKAVDPGPTRLRVEGVAFAG
ncbi:MAG: hypothetical protein ACE5O2_04830 [Armatimonadota bacterium]